MTGSYSASQDLILPLSSITERLRVLKIVNLFVHKIFMTKAMAYLQYILLQLSSIAISSFPWAFPSNLRSSLALHYLQNGLATFLVSVRPVIGSRNSFQLIGNIVFPTSLFAMITPNSFFAVLR